jgi:cobalt-zinc-cadmium efflux system outer membrane protein
MLVPIARITSLAAAACLAACGCVSAYTPQEPTRLTPVPGTSRGTTTPAPSNTAVVPASYRESPSARQAPQSPPSPPSSPLEALTVLTAEDAVRIVLERNPTLDQIRASAAALAARYSQVTSLDDPMFSFNTAPGSAWSGPGTDYAARVEISQKFLSPGKRGLKGTAARAEAAAAAEDIEDARLQLAEATRSALADYYLAVKGSAVAEENGKLLSEFRKNAETLYKNGKGQQQEILQEDLEIARLEERVVTLRRARQVAIAQLNTLMHLPPDGPLPPPADLGASGVLPEVTRLRELASERPDIRAAVSRVAAEEATLALALKQYNPDVEVMGAYDGFWQESGGRPLQWQVGARVNIPLQYGRLSGAVNEARANVARRRAELARLTDQVNLQVQEAFEKVRETDEIVHLYETKILKAAEANVKEAQTAYINAKIPFLNFLEAQRNRVALTDRYYEAVAESARRRAALERVVGRPIVAPGH